MKFETHQKLNTGQQLRLAPRIIQAMEILQLPLPALEEKIEQLRSLVSEQKMEAYDEAILIAQHWPRVEHANQLDRVVELLDLFDFANAATLIEDISQSL